jgi:hypothetical protein
MARALPPGERADGWPDWVASPTSLEATVPEAQQPGDSAMKWIKPEAEVVAVTMEVTAYVATL